VEAAERERDALAQKLRAAEGVRDAALMQRDAAERQQAALQQDHEALQQDHEALEEDYDSLEKQLDALDKQLTEAKAPLKVLRKKHKMSPNQLLDSLSALPPLRILLDAKPFKCDVCMDIKLGCDKVRQEAEGRRQEAGGRRQRDLEVQRVWFFPTAFVAFVVLPTGDRQPLRLWLQVHVVQAVHGGQLQGGARHGAAVPKPAMQAHAHAAQGAGMGRGWAGWGAEDGGWTAGCTSDWRAAARLDGRQMMADGWAEDDGWRMCF
jgi:hypothetical protein